MLLFQVIGNRLAQVHFYKKEDAHGNPETMETLVHKSSNSERSTNPTTAQHGQYPSISNTNPAVSIQTTPATQIVQAQPAAIPKAAKPVRDSAQFVSRFKH